MSYWQNSPTFGYFGFSVEVGAGVDVRVESIDGIGLGVGSVVFDGVGEVPGAGTTFGITGMPLFHASFFPTFMQVNLIFETVLVEFNFVQDVPAIEAETAGINVPRKIALTKIANSGNFARIIWRD